MTTADIACLDIYIIITSKKLCVHLHQLGVIHLMHENSFVVMHWIDYLHSISPPSSNCSFFYRACDLPFDMQTKSRSYFATEIRKSVEDSDACHHE